MTLASDQLAIVGAQERELNPIETLEVDLRLQFRCAKSVQSLGETGNGVDRFKRACVTYKANIIKIIRCLRGK